MKMVNKTFKKIIVAKHHQWCNTY